MQQGITNRKIVGIVVWRLLWMVSAAALLQLFMVSNA